SRRDLRPGAGAVASRRHLADRCRQRGRGRTTDGRHLAKPLVGGGGDGARAHRRLGADQRLCLRGVPEADHRRARHRPRHLLVGADPARDDRGARLPRIRLADRPLGRAPAMLPGLVLYTLSIAAGSLIRAEPFAVTFLIFALTGLTGPVGGPIPYSTVTSQWFDRQRGLALGIGMAGVGLGVALVPPFAALLITHIGWRMAYLGIAGAVVVLAFAPVALFIREPPGYTAAPRRGESRGAALGLPGAGVGEAFRSGLFWALGLAFFLDVIAINGTLTHIVALLTDRGVALPVATAALSGTGIALLGGRILSGFLLDRFWGPYVAVGFFALPMVGLAL